MLIDELLAPIIQQIIKQIELEIFDLISPQKMGYLIRIVNTNSMFQPDWNQNHQITATDLLKMIAYILEEYQ